MPKVKGESALNKERAKTEKLLKKVGYTAMKEAGLEATRPPKPKDRNAREVAATRVLLCPQTYGGG